MEKVRWRGTWGVGDFMMALQTVHNYCYYNDTKVNLEMHWATPEGHLETPKDPETIVERMEWIHTKFHRQEDVTITHVYNSDLFPSSNTSRETKKRYYFESGKYTKKQNAPKGGVFKKREYRKPNPKGKNIVFWTPTYNSEPPRSWKRFLTNDDWWGIIKLLRREGWILQELTYRTPIKEAYEKIQNADYVLCYDGMWHYIAGQLGKPMFIPSWEEITGYACPQVVCRPNRDEAMQFITTFTEEGRHQMIEKAIHIKRKKLGRYFEDR